MKDFFESLNNNMKTRLKNPILGGFIISWIIFNWRPIVFVILSDRKIEERFDYIDQHLINKWNGFIWPSIVSIAIFIALPYLMWCLERATRYGRSLRKTQNSLDINKDLILEIGRVDLHQQLEDKKARYLDREKLNEHIKKLENEVLLKNAEIDKHNKVHERVSQTLKGIEDTNSVALYFADVILTEESAVFKNLPDDIQGEVESSFLEIALMLTSYDRLNQFSMSLSKQVLINNDLVLKVCQERNTLEYSGKTEDDFTDITKWSLTSIGMRAILEIQRNRINRHVDFGKSNDD